MLSESVHPVHISVSNSTTNIQYIPILVINTMYNIFCTTDWLLISAGQHSPAAAEAFGEFLSLIWLASSISVIGGLFLDLATTLLITLRHSHLARQGKWIILMGIIPLLLRFPLLSMWGKMDEMCDWVEKWHGCSVKMFLSWALNMTGGC